MEGGKEGGGGEGEGLHWLCQKCFSVLLWFVVKFFSRANPSKKDCQFPFLESCKIHPWGFLKLMVVLLYCAAFCVFCVSV